MIHRPRVAAAALIALFLALSRSTVALAQIDAAQFRHDLNGLSRHASRSIGSDGYYEAANYLEKTIAGLPNVELRKHEFPVMVPVTQSATLDLGGGRVERVFPFWPAHVRVNATPPDGIAGNLVYAGECRYEQLRPASLHGHIAIVEASAGGRWMDAAYMGAKAILVLGARETSWPDLNSHD